jgi:hypothetical protein
MTAMSWLLSHAKISTKTMQQVQDSQNIFFTACYRFYAQIKPKKVKFHNLVFFSDQVCYFMQLTQSKAASECCKYGLKLASLDSPFELKCVNGFLSTGAAHENDYFFNTNFAPKCKEAAPGAYWTSGTGVEGEFLWCPSGKDIDGELWIPTEKPKSKKCVSLVVGEASGLENTSCDKTLLVLCESNKY